MRYMKFIKIRPHPIHIFEHVDPLQYGDWNLWF